MSIEEIKEKLHYALINEGIYVDDDDMMIAEYIPDSLAFASLIVQIECQFDIELPDEILECVSKVISRRNYASQSSVAAK